MFYFFAQRESDPQILNKAWSDIFKGNYDSAYSKFLSENNTVEGQLGLAYYYRKINDLDRAESIASEVLALNDSRYNFYALSMLGVIYNARKDYDLSISYIKEALEGNFLKNELTYKRDYSVLGWAYFSKGNYNDAVTYFKNESFLDILISDAYYGLSFAYLAQLDYMNAEKHMRIYNLVIPDGTPPLDLKTLHILVAERLYEALNFNDSIRVALSGLNGSYDNYQLLDILGLDYLGQNRTIDAFEMFNRSEILNDSDYLNQHGLGRVYYRLGKYENAEKYFNRSIELAPDKAITYEGLGNLYFFQGEYDKAKDVFEAGISKTDEMDDCQLFRHMAQISDIMNDTEDSAYYHAKAKRYENLCIVEAD